MYVRCQLSASPPRQFSTVPGLLRTLTQPRLLVFHRTMIQNRNDIFKWVSRTFIVVTGFCPCADHCRPCLRIAGQKIHTITPFCRAHFRTGMVSISFRILVTVHIAYFVPYSIRLPSHAQDVCVHAHGHATAARPYVNPERIARRQPGDNIRLFERY